MKKEPKKEDIIYLAGIMDADGYFTIKRNTYGVRVIKDCKNPRYSEKVGIKQTSNKAIKIIYQYFGGYYRLEKPTAKNGKPLYAVSLECLKAHEFVKAVYPYLRIKKQQAEILLQLRESINRGRTKRLEYIKKTKSGKLVEMVVYAINDDEIRLRENLIKKVKRLNDSRNDVTHQPIPWK